MRQWWSTIYTLKKIYHFDDNISPSIESKKKLSESRMIFTKPWKRNETKPIQNYFFLLYFHNFKQNFHNLIIFLLVRVLVYKKKVLWIFVTFYSKENTYVWKNFSHPVNSNEKKSSNAKLVKKTLIVLRLNRSLTFFFIITQYILIIKGLCKFLHNDWDAIPSLKVKISRTIRL